MPHKPALRGIFRRGGRCYGLQFTVRLLHLAGNRLHGALDAERYLDGLRNSIRYNLRTFVAPKF